MMMDYFADLIVISLAMGWIMLLLLIGGGLGVVGMIRAGGSIGSEAQYQAGQPQDGDNEDDDEDGQLAGPVRA
jgi:F0F1-type ATP synthase assembly protein I